jgi:ribosome-associated toxin RatA of RatAB toxin-antitoxin module
MDEAFDCMKTVHKSVLIWFSADEMFSLVTDVDRYPQFLPWCDQASVLSREEQAMTARVGISFGGIRQSFTTRNAHRPGRQIHMELVEGPFSKLEGQWDFTPLGDGQRACKVEFSLRYDFNSVALAAIVGPVFDRIAGSLVDAFVKRANQVYEPS